MSEFDSGTTGGSEKDLSRYKGPEGIHLRWMKELSLVRESKPQRNFERIGEKINKIYSNASAVQSASAQDNSESRVMVNILWSNIQVMKPSLFCRIPKSVVERRFKDSDPVGRLSCTVAERSTSFMLSIQQDRFMYAVKAAVEDRLIPGRGQVWLRYTAEFQEGDPEQVSGQDVLEAAPQEGSSDQQQLPVPEQVKLNTERVLIDSVHWLDYFHSAARNPFEIRWHCRRVYMSRSELIKRFGEEIGKAVEFLADSPGMKKKKLSKDEQQFLMQAEVFEIWDFANRQTIWISPGYTKGPLDIKDDTLHLAGFFPCPNPLLATTTTDSMYPTPDYKIYERLAEEVDYISKRISSMADCIRFVGATAAQFNKDIKDMLKLADGQLWPIEAWSAFAEKEGFKGIIDWMPFENAVAALQPLSEYKGQLLEQIDLIIGIPDIAKGQTDPNETADAQQRKSKWAVLKLQEKQQDVQRFCREIISKMAEIIFEPGLFADETIQLMCGFSQMSMEDQQNFPAALALLRDDRLRTFRVDIETDSTIAVDEDADQSSRMNYMKMIAELIGEVESVSQFRPELMQPILESALFATRAFRTGRPLESSWEKAAALIEKNDADKAANPQPPPPDPQLIRAQADAQAAQDRVQIESMKAQTEQMKNAMAQQKQNFDQFMAQREESRKTEKDQADYTIKQQAVQIEGLKVQTKSQIDQTAQALEAFKERFRQFAETQLIRVEQVKVASSVKEQALEESRAQRQQHIDALKVVNEHIGKITTHLAHQTNHINAIAENQRVAKESGISNKVNESQPAQVPAIHIHGGGPMKLTKGADGSWVSSPVASLNSKE